MSSQQLANDQYDGFKNQVGMHKVQLQLWVAVSMVIIFNALYMYMCYVGTTLYAPTYKVSTQCAGLLLPSTNLLLHRIIVVGLSMAGQSGRYGANRLTIPFH